MKKSFAALTALVCLVLGALGPAAAEDPPWFALLGDDPVFQDSMRRMLTSQENAANNLLFPNDPGQDPNAPNPNGNWQSMSDVLSAFVNIHKLSGDAHYKDVAKRVAEWLLAWNSYLVAHRDPAIPYLGWGPESRQFYFTCDNKVVSNYKADDAWDTAAALRGLLKYSELEVTPTTSPYFQRAKSILDAWSTRTHASNDGNPDTPGLVNDGSYAAAGHRWYAKSNDPCEIRYVKNTNLVMGEALFRLYKLTANSGDLQAATNVLHGQLWDILTHRNFGYDSFMIYVYRAGTIFHDVIAPDRDLHKVIHTNPGAPDDEIRCKDPTSDASCWNHLGFEAYDLYVIKQLIRDLAPGVFPVPNTHQDVAEAITRTMTIYRTSIFGDTASFAWGTTSATHITAYNCAQRFSADPMYLSECVSALRNSPSGGTIFYSLVPDAIFTEGPGR